jgi:cell division protease FtsH
MTRGEMENKMAVLLGGRAAEMLIFGRESTGAADDFAKATDIARAMVMRFGMNEKLGLVAWEEERREFLAGAPMPAGPRRYSEQTAREIDDAVRDTVHRAFETASAILARARVLLERGARALLEKETLQEDDLQELRGELPAAPDALRISERRRTVEA